jgi:class 3 adenylate cyclase
MVQQLLQPGERRELQPALEPGRYRLRALGVAGGQYLSVAEDGEPRAALRYSWDGWADEEHAVLTRPVLTLENATADEALLVLERLDWTLDAVTAGEVIRLQTFRDLFSGELLRPGEEISVSSLTIAFTDLRDSTRMYQQIGDATAFGRVLDHFDLLRAELTAQDGAMIKTIGDAVMAVFPRPLAGVKAMLSAQSRLLAAEDESAPIILKVGLHAGPCIAVTLNGRLDYFGTTVNLASRLERYSNGSDIIVSDAVRMDPEVEQYIAGEESLALEPFNAEVKGFEGKEARLWRISRRPEMTNPSGPATLK